MRRETIGNRRLLVPPDVAVAEFARRQHGVVATAQLTAAGLDSAAITRRIARGGLHRLHRGVYAVGHTAVSWRGRLWAAVLASGGVLSHRTAAALWDLMTAPAGDIHVTTLRRGASFAGVRVHRSVSLDPARDVVHEPDGLPLTSVARTLIDLADVLDSHRLTRAFHRAEELRLLDVAAIEALPGRRSRVVRAALASLGAGVDVTRSEFEERFLAFVAERGLPRPRVNAVVAGYEVDFLWPDARLIVETDGAAAHLTRRAFEADRERDAELQACGYRVLRVTWRQLTQEPDRLERRLRALLSPARPRS